MINEVFKTTKDIKETTLALLSDIHYYPGYNKKVLERLLNQIKKVKPTYTCILGDIIDDSKYTDIDPLIDWLKEISKVSKVIAVLGNHDEKSGSMWSWKHQKNTKLIEKMKKIDNLELLEDSTFEKDNITFYGFNLSFDYYETFDEIYESFEKEANNLKIKLNKDNYIVTLCHSPINIYKYIKKNPDSELSKSDIILSGHMHNGCLPSFASRFINKTFKSTRSIISPLKTIFPKYSQGRVYESQEGYIYSGVSKLSYSTKAFHKFDVIYQKNIELITIKKDK